MTYQQLAMSRVRAVEHDRAVLVVTTSGVSATIAPDGTVTAATSSSPPMSWSTQPRCGTPLRWQIGCGRRPEWALLVDGWPGSGRLRVSPGRDGRAHGRRGRGWLRDRRGRCWW